MLLICLATLINAQQASTAVTIDASRLDGVLNLPGPFPTQTTDDPGFADPNFDDSAWPKLRPGQSLADVDPKRASEHYAWVRIHLHIVNAHGPLAIAIGHRDYAYTVYANGRQIAASAAMASLTPFYDPPFAIALPPAQEITLAIRFYHVKPLTRSPLGRIQLGSPSVLISAIELARIREFDNDLATEFILGLVLLAFAAFFLVLYLAQRQRPEYLWLALYCFWIGGFFLVNIGILNGNLSDGTWARLARASFGFYGDLCSLEFVVRFVRAKARWPLRLVELILFLAPLEVFFPFIPGYVTVPALTLWFIAFGYFLVQAFRTGNVENRLLLPPWSLVALSALWAYALQIFPRLYYPTFQVGRFGVIFGDIAVFLFLIGILAVVLYRFIRVTRDEQRAAAEFEAARVVQQVLVPVENPTIPGFRIDSLYLPAGQVGGDFYQVIPNGSGGVLVVVGDVSGKGMPAAMTVSLLVGTFRTLAHYTSNPGEILSAMNQRMLARSHGGFTTCLVLRVDPDGAVTLANAGHIAPYLGGKELSIENGLPLGLSATAVYDEARFHLSASQQLTLMTDGVVEATNPATKELFGFDRTQQISGESADGIAAAAQAFGQEDDITVLTLQYAPAEVAHA
jgi:hypothetical protein